MILAQLFGFSASILAFGTGFLMIIGSGDAWFIICHSCDYFVHFLDFWNFIFSANSEIIFFRKKFCHTNFSPIRYHSANCDFSHNARMFHYVMLSNFLRKFFYFWIIF